MKQRLIDFADKKSKPKVLVVDDDNDIIDLVSIYLEDDFDVLSAMHANAAYMHLEKNDFSMIIIDIFLPETDGKKIIREIRRRESKTPILAISGYLQRDEFIHEASQIGANEFVEKPFLLGTFLSAVNKLKSKL